MVFFNVEAILDSRLLRYYYEDNGEGCLTPYHLLLGRQLKFFIPDPLEISYTPADLNVHSKKINNILNHFRGPWKKEYLINLRENHKVKLQKFIARKIVVTVEEERQSKSMWRVGIIEKLLKGKDGQVRGAKVRVCGSV